MREALIAGPILTRGNARFTHSVGPALGAIEMPVRGSVRPPRRRSRPERPSRLCRAPGLIIALLSRARLAPADPIEAFVARIR